MPEHKQKATSMPNVHRLLYYLLAMQAITNYSTNSLPELDVVAVHIAMIAFGVTATAQVASGKLQSQNKKSKNKQHLF